MIDASIPGFDDDLLQKKKIEEIDAYISDIIEEELG